MENKNDEFSGEDDEDDDLENKGETGADNSEDNKLQITKGGKPINKIVEITPGGGFGKFDEEIGCGTFKRVFRGYDFNAGREIAWNRINVANMEEKSLNRISEEINIMKKLNHEHIINYISGWYDKERKEIVIITEILPGGSLKQHLAKIKSPRLRLVKNWIKQILKGLKYLHTEINPPIIHRDIKCDNIFIDNTTGGIKIGDLGICDEMHSSYAKSYEGTKGFMAPEVFEGRYTVLADIYSLGMCILEMVTFEKPYKECDDFIMQIYEKVKNGIIPKSLERIQNESLKDFILKCLRPEYERPNSIQLLNDPFLTSLGSEENNYPVNLIELPQEEFKISSKHRSTLSFIFPNEDELVPIISDKSLKSSSTSLYKNTMNSASKDSLTNFSTSNPISSKNKPPSRVISPFVSINPLSTSVSKTHKVSLKNSLNQGQGSFTKFEINIIENPTETIGDIVQIIFIVHKIKKQRIQFNYDLRKDTIEGVVTELQKEIELNDEECKIVLTKLHDFVSKFKTNLPLEQKNSLDNCDSTTAEPENFCRRKSLENFSIAFNKLTNKIQNLMAQETTEKIEEIKKIYDSKYKNDSSEELRRMIGEYDQNMKKLSKIRNNIKK